MYTVYVNRKHGSTLGRRAAGCVDGDHSVGDDGPCTKQCGQIQLQCDTKSKLTAHVGVATQTCTPSALSSWSTVTSRVTAPPNRGTWRD